MPAFYLTFLAVLLAGIGARDQAVIAGLADRQGRRPMVLVVALATSALTALAAAWLATIMLAQLPPPARFIFAAIALGLAGLESLLLAPPRAPREPTNSLGALAVVLMAHQITDAPRFLVFGMGVGLGAAGMAGAAGIAGGMALVTFAWVAPHLIGTAAARWTRRATGLALVLAALTMFLRQFGIV